MLAGKKGKAKRSNFFKVDKLKLDILKLLTITGIRKTSCSKEAISKD